MSDQNEDLKALKCKECGGDIVKSHRPVGEDDEIPIARCISCGKEYDQHSSEYYEYFADDFTYDRDDSLFSLGAKGTFHNVEYEIIGRLRYQEEDEEEKSTWDEWVAISSDGVFHYFVEEEGKVFSFEEYIPESIDMESSSSSIEFEGKDIPRSKGYIGRIVFAEGELPWQVEIGEAVTCYDFKKDGHKYSIEQSEGEVTISKGKRVSYKTLMNAFQTDEYKDRYNNTIKKRNQYKLKGRIYLGVMIFSLLASIYNCSSSQMVKGVMNRSVLLPLEADEARSKEHISKVLYGPFKIDHGKGLYSVTVAVNEKIQRLDQEWQSFRLFIIKEENLRKISPSLNIKEISAVFSSIDSLAEPVESYMVYGDFWDERGYDSEGSWHESDLSADSDFVLDEMGQYFAYMELNSQKIRNYRAVAFKIEKINGYRYFVMLFFVFLVLMFINKFKSKSYNELPFEVADE